MAGSNKQRGGSGRAVGASALGQNRKVPTTLPGITNDRWKWNRGGTALASDAERRQMFARERRREKNYLLAGQQQAGAVRAQRRALRLTLDGRDSKAYSPINVGARAALDRRSMRASKVFKGQRPPRRMGQRAAARYAKRRASSERIGRAALAEYQRQGQYLEARTLRSRRY